jgi:hypothetical protein
LSSGVGVVVVVLYYAWFIPIIALSSSQQALSAYRSAGRYKMDDAVTKKVLRIPSVKVVARHTRPKEQGPAAEASRVVPLPVTSLL